MGYGVKWVETHLGVSRKALRNYEDHGIMPKYKYRNRDYDDNDIKNIWSIRVLQGMGFTVKEIADICKQAKNDENFSLQPFISDKIEKLKLEIEERKKHLGYAKTIKLFGRFPAFPREMGQVTCQEFRERSIEQWNMEIDEHDKKYLRLAEILLSNEIDQIGEIELGMMFESIIDMFTPGSKMNKTIELNVLLQGLTDSKDKEPSDIKVQVLVEMLHKQFINIANDEGDLSAGTFARHFSHTLILGDQGELMAKRYGKEGCLFAANAIAVYGGFASYQDLCDQVFE